MRDLRLSAQNCHFSIVEYMLIRKADINAKIVNGKTFVFKVD